MSALHRPIVLAVLLAVPLACSSSASTRPAPKAAKGPVVEERSGPMFTATRSNAVEDTIPPAEADRDEDESAPPAPPAPCAVHSEAVPQGIALHFDSRTAPPEEIQKHARRLAQIIEELRKHGEASPDPETFGLRQIAALEPQVVAIPNRDGARLVLTTSEPTEVEALRAEVIWHTADLLPDLLRDQQGCPAVPGETASLE
jgi:hypothetical protein